MDIDGNVEMSAFLEEFNIILRTIKDGSYEDRDPATEAWLELRERRKPAASTSSERIQGAELEHGAEIEMRSQGARIDLRQPHGVEHIYGPAHNPQGTPTMGVGKLIMPKDLVLSPSEEAVLQGRDDSTAPTSQPKKRRPPTKFPKSATGVRPRATTSV